MKIPPNTLAFGRPAKVVRELTEDDIKEMKRISREYAEKAQYYKSLQEKRTRKTAINVYAKNTQERRGARHFLKKSRLCR